MCYHRVLLYLSILLKTALQQLKRLQSYSLNHSTPSHLSFANRLINHLPLVPDLLTHFSTVPLNYSPAEHTPQRSKMSFMIPAHCKALETHQSLIFPFLWLTYLQKLIVYSEIQQGKCITMDSSAHSFRTGISRLEVGCLVILFHQCNP